MTFPFAPWDLFFNYKVLLWVSIYKDCFFLRASPPQGPWLMPPLNPFSTPRPPTAGPLPPFLFKGLVEIGGVAWLRLLFSYRLESRAFIPFSTDCRVIPAKDPTDLPQLLSLSDSEGLTRTRKDGFPDVFLPSAGQLQRRDPLSPLRRSDC